MLHNLLSFSLLEHGFINTITQLSTNVNSFLQYFFHSFYNQSIIHAKIIVNRKIIKNFFIKMLTSVFYCDIITHVRENIKRGKHPWIQLYQAKTRREQ